MPNQREEREQHPRAPNAEAAVLEPPHVEHREPRAQLPPHEEAEDRDRSARNRERLGREPAVVRSFDDCVDEADDAHDRQQCAGDVDACRRRVARLRQQFGAGHEGNQYDGDIDEENGVPRIVLQQEATRDRAERTARARDRGPDRDGLGPLPHGEHVHDDRERGRHHERGAESHRGETGDHRRRRLCDRTGQCGNRKDPEADLKRTLAPEPVAQRPRGEQQPGEHQRVRVDDPLEVAVGSLEIAGHGWQRHVERRIRDHHGGEARAEHGQDRPTARMAGQFVGGHGISRSAGGSRIATLA